MGCLSCCRSGGHEVKLPALAARYQSYATTTNSYTWYAGAATSQIAHNDGQGHTYYTYYTYGSGGVLNSVYVADGRPHSIAFTNDMAGQALRRDESDNNYASGDPHEVWYRFDGRQLGYTGNNGTLDTDYQGSGGGSYTVRGGESLSSIAASLWGDAGLWYQLAGATPASGGVCIDARSLRIDPGPGPEEADQQRAQIEDG